MLLTAPSSSDERITELVAALMDAGEKHMGVIFKERQEMLDKDVAKLLQVGVCRSVYEYLSA